MSQITKININPAILKWAREEAGYLPNELITKLSINEKKYQEWEESGSQVPYGKLKLIASLFKRQIAVFFLNDIPKQKKKPVDYRNLNIFSPLLSKETLLAFRRVNKYRSLIAINSGETLVDRSRKIFAEYNGIFYNNNIDDIEVAKWIRLKLDYSIEQQKKEKDLLSTFKAIRSLIEEKFGIFVFQLSMPEKELQGFSYAGEFPYCIIVNKNNYESSKIFTLLHELGHLLNQQSAICYPEKVSSKQDLELLANKFAGNILIPDEIIKPLFTQEEIYKYAKKIKVSSEAYLRRMYALDIVTTYEYHALIKEIKSNIQKRKKNKVVVTPLQKCINSRGHLFYDNVLSWVKNEKINYRTASDALGVKVNYYINAL